MPNSDNINAMLGYGAAAIAQSQTAAANRRAEDLARRLRREIEENASNQGSDGKMARYLEEAQDDKVRAEIVLKHVRNHSAELLAVKDAAIAEKDALILEWMHSNEAFKRLARQYGKKLGVTDEERQKDFDNNVLNVAEEDVNFENTKKTAGARKRLGVGKK